MGTLADSVGDDAVDADRTFLDISTFLRLSRENYEGSLSFLRGRGGWVRLREGLFK